MEIFQLDLLLMKKLDVERIILMLQKFGADFAYTIDGGAIGELEYESFNACSAIVDIKGKNVHPGSAKDIMRIR